MNPRDRIIGGLLCTLAYDWCVHQHNKKRYRALRDAHVKLINEYNELVDHHNGACEIATLRVKQVEHLLKLLEEHGIQLEEFDYIVLNNL